MNPDSDEVPLSSSSKWSWIYVVCLAGTLLLISVLSAPLVLRAQNKSPLTGAVSNARMIGLALSEFEQEYNSMPDFGTAKEVRASTLTSLNLGTSSSNGFFRQLIGADVCQSEALFYAQIAGAHKPDNVFSGTKALEKGECGFTYILGYFPHCNPARPLVVTPMIPGTDRFDPKPFEGKVVVLKADNSVTSLPIDKQGHAVFQGRNLMDPKHPVWQGKPPSIAWPDL